MGGRPLEVLPAQISWTFPELLIPTTLLEVVESKVLGLGSHALLGFASQARENLWHCLDVFNG